MTWLDLEGNMLSEMSEKRERQLLYDSTNMQNLKNKTNKRTQNRNTVIDTQNKQVVTKREDSRGWKEVVKG